MLSKNQIYYAFVESPLGPVLLVRDDVGLIYINFQDGSNQLEIQLDWEQSDAALKEAIEQIGDYFQGDRKLFDLTLSTQGTEFQEQVWQAVCDIPYGSTDSYGSIAKQINRPKASRAVGAANGQNRLPIVIPCHRVVGSSGKLTGYAGGVHLKKWLLNHESGQRSLLP